MKKVVGGNNTHRNQIMPSSSLMEIPEQHIVGASLAHEEEKEPMPRHGSAMHLMNNTADMPGHQLPDGGRAYQQSYS